jgi:hypothetical protein
VSFNEQKGGQCDQSSSCSPPIFDRDRDLRIPEKSQTLDDGQVLREAGRHFIPYYLGAGTGGGIERLLKEFS